MTEPLLRKALSDFRWEGVEQLPYKEDDRALFKSITRQVLFSDPNMAGELPIWSGRSSCPGLRLRSTTTPAIGLLSGSC